MKINNDTQNTVVFDFYKNYANDVAPLFELYEKQRKRKLGYLLLLEIGLVILTISLKFFLFDLYFYITLIVIISAMILVPIYMADNFQKNLKNNCMHKLLKAFGNISWMRNATVISDYEIKESEIFGTYTERTDDDCFNGTSNGVKFEISETKLLNVIKSRKQKWVWQVFKGVIISFSSNKDIKNKTIVTTKGDINTRNSNPLLWIITIYTCTMFGFNIIVSEFSFEIMFLAILMGCTIFCLFIIIWNVVKQNKTERLDKITLEDVEFNKKYDAYSSDEIEGRYLLTTAFMERFKNLHTAFGAKRAKCSFFDDKIMFSISTNKNLFEIGNLFVPLNNPKQINVFLNEISAIYKLIDYFKLDKKTGL